MTTLALSAERYMLAFHIQELIWEPALQGHYCKGVFSLTTDAIETKPPIECISGFPYSDLMRLAAWIRAHIAQLPINPASLDELVNANADPKVWVPLDVTAEVWLLSGEKSVLDDGTEEGEFTVWASLLIGEDERETHSHLHVGLQSGIAIKDALRFCDDIDDLYSQLEVPTQ